MSHHHKLREDKNCQNCGHHVEDRYCPHCGQENIETRQPFHYLFTHFMEDLTHYDGEFWRSIKDLIMKPGRLTTTYLDGKRKKYVVPVKLYIFISFIAFFLPAILPSFGKHESSHKEAEATPKETKELKKSTYDASMKTFSQLHDNHIISDSVYKVSVTELKNKLAKDTIETTKTNDNEDADIDEFADAVANKDESYLNNSFLHGAKTKEAYDSIIAKKGSGTFGFFQNAMAHKIFEWKEEGATTKELKEKFIEHFLHNLPKLIFVYMPFFAFLLWLVIDKKKFWYFDCGIFTLHYFSFLLLIITISIVLGWLFSLINIGLITALGVLFSIFLFFYAIIYFFKAYKRVFQKHRLNSIGNGLLLFFVNMFFMFLFLVGYFVLTIYLLH